LDYASLDDAALIACIARAYGAHGSDPHLNAAVGALYDRFGRLVYSVAIHTVGDTETAEEITQDVFVRACEGASGYRPETARLSSWLVSIARHRAIDELRRRGSRPEKERADWPEDIGLESAVGMPDIEGPEAQVEKYLTNHGLRRVVATLPIEQRKVLSLAFFRGLSQSEIAEQLGEPLGTVKSRIRLAMQKLRETLSENDFWGP
jgi:RNA polymerase sigma-70 factor (ECF subfamily)